MAVSFRKKTIKNLGSVFGESLDSNSSPVGNYHVRSFPHRSVIGRVFLLSIFVVGFIILSTRLFYLTVVKGTYYKDLSNNNRMREEQIPPPRGILYARDGTVLAVNRPIYKQCDDTTGSCKYLSRDDALAMEAEGYVLTVELGRQYPESASVAHVVGYMSEITSKKMKEENSKLRQLEGVLEEDYCQSCYLMGTYVGAYGAEETFEQRLRGKPGKRLVEVDSKGNEINELARVEPREGENITLSLDLNLQKRGIISLEKQVSKTGEGGAFVALNPKTGEVLAMYSAPSFNPNLFVFSDPSEIEDFVRSKETNTAAESFSNTDAAEILSKDVELLDELSYTNTSLADVLLNKDKPLFNRVISGLYPPASTFKIITATAGLEEGVLDKDTLVEDTGVITVGRFSFANWYYLKYAATEGKINIEQALARSNDVFFYKVGEWLGIEKLEYWAKMFGLEQPTGIELSGEAQGLFRRERKWYLGDTYHVSIGQGDLQTTPLQVASYTQILANDGMRCRPTILMTDESEAECEKLPISDDTLRSVHNGILRACSPGGTAGILFNFSVNTASGSSSIRKFSYDSNDFTPLDNGGTQIAVACKTGTSEFGGEDEKRTHGWLTAYAPAGNPEIVITVLVEAGGEGSSVAAPVVKDMLKEWFSKDR